MYNIKRVTVFIVVLAVAAFVGSSFVGSNIMERAIIIGMGIDGERGNVRLTAEIVSPSGDEQVGTFSKTITAEGESLAQAIQRIAELTGKEASLGRCLVFVFGQEYFEQNDLSYDIDYLINSDSFKESSAICCCSGSARDLLNKSSSLSQSVSMAISEAFFGQAKQTATVTNTLLDFTLSQRSMLKTGFLNCVKFVSSDNENEQSPEKEQGYFSLKDIAVFCRNKYERMLTEDEAKGFALFSDGVVGDTFVTTVSDKQLTISVDSKSVDKKLKDGVIECSIKLYGKLVRNDSADVEGIFVYKDKQEIPQSAVDDVVAQATALCNAIVGKQAEYNFDLLDLHETLRQKQGSSEQLENTPTSQIPVEVKVEFAER